MFPFFFFRRTFWALQKPSQHRHLWRTRLSRACLCRTATGNPPPPASFPAAQNTLLFLTVPTAALRKGRVQRSSFRVKRIYTLRGRVLLRGANLLFHSTALFCLNWRGTRRPCGVAGTRKRRTEDWRCNFRETWTGKSPWTAGRVRPIAISSGKKALRLPRVQTRMRRVR